MSRKESGSVRGLYVKEFVFIAAVVMTNNLIVARVLLMRIRGR
jgi:hypothetical protein